MNNAVTTQETYIPKYVTVKQNIIRGIDNDIFHIGQLIPSERELIESYGVSRITIRKALSELEHEGYLYKVQGKGTYVKGDENRQNLFSLTSCTHDIIKLGMTPSRKVIYSGIVEADKKRQQKLNIKEGEKLFSLNRVYYADDEPINFTKTYLPYKYIKGIEGFDFSKASHYEVLEAKYNITITRAVRTVEAVIAHDEICELLNIQKGVPLLLFECVTYANLNSHEVPIETFKCFYRSDRFSFFINQIK